MKVLVHRAPVICSVSPRDVDFQFPSRFVASGRAAAPPDPHAPRLLSSLDVLGAARRFLPSPFLRPQPIVRVNCGFDATELRVERTSPRQAAQVVTELRGLVIEHPLRRGSGRCLIRALEEQAAGRGTLRLTQARQVISDELAWIRSARCNGSYAGILAADATVRDARHRSEPVPLVPAELLRRLRAVAAQPPAQTDPTVRRSCGIGSAAAAGRRLNRPKHRNRHLSPICAVRTFAGGRLPEADTSALRDSSPRAAPGGHRGLHRP